MSLKHNLDALPGDRELVLSSSGVWEKARVVAQPRNAARLAGIKVALCIADAGVALRALCVLDGIAQQILLLSPAAHADLNISLATRAQCDALITDDLALLAVPSECLLLVPTIESLIAARAQWNGVVGEKTRWIMTTSGTTGTPKLVSHSFASLTRSTKIDATRGLGQKWGMVYDYTRFAGMQVLLQSVCSGALLLAPNYGMALNDKLMVFSQHGCTHLSATPTFWRKITMIPNSEKLNLKQVTMGGEIADDRILSVVSARYPTSRVAHIFASTEAGVGFSVADGKAGFPESYLSSPPAGVEIRVVEDILHVRNPHVASRYLGEQTVLSQDDGWVDTGDAVSIRDGRVIFLGRASGVINVGGDKVHPEQVEQVLLSHPDVAAARVYARSNPITGALVAADIVVVDPDAEVKSIKKSVESHAASLLERHQMPVLLKVVSDFDVNAAGKLLRNDK